MTEETAIAAVALAHVSKNQFLLQFSGGEPLLQFPLIRKVVDFVEKNHVNAQMQIQTNGALLTKDIGKWLFDHHVGIGISCDGRPELMNSLRVSKNGDRSSQKVIQAFQNLGEVNIEAGITCVVTDDTVEQLDGIAGMSIRLVLIYSESRGAEKDYMHPLPSKWKKHLKGLQRKWICWKKLQENIFILPRKIGYECCRGQGSMSFRNVLL